MPPIAFKYFAPAGRRVDISRTKFVLPFVPLPPQSQERFLKMNRLCLPRCNAAGEVRT